jgi:type IV secretion system protein VirB10
VSARENSIEAVDVIGGDRGIPSVNEQRSGGAFKKIQIILFLAFGMLFILVMVYFSFIRKSQDAENSKPAKNLQITNAVPERGFDLPPAPPQEVIPVVPDNFVAAPMPDMQVDLPPPEVDKSGSSLMLAASAGRAGNPDGEDAPMARRGGSGEGALAGMLTGTRTSSETALMLPDRNFLLTKGNSIECALLRRLDSTVSGTTACLTNRNVYSVNGRVLLIERGSRLVGEYRGGIKQGEARIFVLWTRIETPNGVIINLDSPGMDALGGAGIPGYVDTHFWKRFGGAVLLSMIDSGLEIAEERAKKTINGDTTTYNSGDNSTDMATEALRNSINIPPTLYVNQGERISVDVARDLDFSKVYDLTVTP